MSRLISALAVLTFLAGCSAEVVVGAGSQALTGTAFGGDEPASFRVGAHDAFVEGVLTQPSDDAPEDVALGFVRGRAGVDLRVARVQPAGEGHLVRMIQRAGALDVVGGGALVRLDGAKRVRWASLRLADLSGYTAGEPAIEPTDALRAARGIADERALDVDPSRHVEPVVYAGPAVREPRLAYYVRFEDALARDTYRAYVDASDGTVLAREGLGARYLHRARVWDVSPVDSELEEVSFEALDPEAETLADDDVAVFGCVDERMCHEVRTTMGVRAVHHCEMRPTAIPDPEESFLVHAPPRSHRAPEDPFAEVQAYHHVRSGLDAFRRWADDPTFAMRNRLTTVVNMRVPDLESDASLCAAPGDSAPAGSELRIEENAYFWPAGQIGPTELGDRIVMHQTERTDWAYDGEIVWHELTHAVMHTVTPLSWRYLDARGLNPEPGGLHEGFSDYFAAAITNRPTLAWYGGTTADGPAPLNDLEKEVHCAEVLDGEEHDESEAWAGALWSIRRSMRSQAKREMFDAVAFTSVSALAQFDGFDRAAQIVLAELEVAAEELAASEEMDDDARAFLATQVDGATDVFSRYGIPGCGGRVATVALDEGREFVQLLGPKDLADVGAVDAVPAPLGLRLRLDAEVSHLHVRIGELELYDQTFPSADAVTEPELAALLRAGDAPIRWQWDLPRGRHDADREAEMTVDDEATSAVATFEGPFAPGVYHFALTNAGASVNAYDIWVSAGAPDSPADGAPAAEAPIAAGCAAGEAPLRPGAWIFALGLVVLRRRRRRLD